MTEVADQAEREGSAVSAGATVRSEGRTITESDILTFAGFTGDFMPLHVDEEYARTTPYGGRILHGNAVLSIASGLLVRTGMFAGHLGMLGMEFRFKLAVRPGDTIHAELAERSSRVDSTGAREVVVYDLTVVNQQGQTVLTGTWTQLRPRS
jgi:acyl dehydratase